jgi:hypothetical protein
MLAVNQGLTEIERDLINFQPPLPPLPPVGDEHFQFKGNIVKPNWVPLPEDVEEGESEDEGEDDFDIDNIVDKKLSELSQKWEAAVISKKVTKS